MLYTLSRSPYNCDLKALLRIAKRGDDCLLLSDGVTAGLYKSAFIEKLVTSPLAVYALECDVFARGLYSYYCPEVKIIGYNDFVKLTEKQSKQIAW